MSSSSNNQSVADKLKESSDPLVAQAESKNTAQAEETHDPKLEKIEAKQEEQTHKLEVEAQPTG
ncbi:hypothetical protein LTR10_006414 [Elasticomyces elasticus]|uniref:Uncharacterized protein n=1 Tax=Elasticomyces elasticus TaxID=574655 RepID=A0AAN7W9L7_9PEZI|nr:hypothetical protein LTR10_006414 [Elasticomyces elasticus]KAK4966539.1 hypothetical protein LTR42_010849 [Elasticomyces elasticus]KAK5697840.1 hypothetical protein LTR97_006798 [Elasticomyces elasticus]KAK5715150.1 hypothetical protein LTR15_010567 [Elasticomyces elasticus]